MDWDSFLCALADCTESIIGAILLGIFITLLYEKYVDPRVRKGGTFEWRGKREQSFTFRSYDRDSFIDQVKVFTGNISPESQSDDKTETGST